MAGSVSRALEDLLNPLPVFADPEDNDDEATKAKVTERLAGEEEEDEEEEGPVRLSALRRRNVTLLEDTDRRYVGKPVTREQLLKDLEGSEEEEEESLDEDEVEGSSIDDDEAEEEEEADDDKHDDDDDDVEEDEKDVTVPPGTDFHKLTEGMDDLGVSEDEDLEGSDDEDEASDDDDDDDEMEEEGGVQTFSQDKVDEGVEKGRAVKNQLSLWDQLLEGRIKIQKALMTANQLPQPDTLPAFRSAGGPEMAGALKTAHKALKALQRTLLELHDHLLYRNEETRAVVAQSGDEEIDSDGEVEGAAAAAKGPPKRKLEMAEYPGVMAKRFAAFRPYCNDTLLKWHDKTRLTTGRGGGGKGFAAFDRNILTQVDQVLTDKDRLLRRTRTRRSEYRVLGKRAAAAAEQQDGQATANQHLRDVDEDVFDDDDFYHQLLRELIERRTSAPDPNQQVAAGRQWLAIQKLRSKIKKKVDTKASKGRKVRFHAHAKLVNFMAPVDCGPMSDEARSELYRGLFGQSAPCGT